MDNNSVNNTISSISVDDRIQNIETSVSTISDASLFLVAFLVVCVVCYILYKAVDNFISF